MNFDSLIKQFASKKLAMVLLAYSIIILDGTSALTLEPAVVVAASTALTTGILAQSAIDYRRETSSRNETLVDEGLEKPTDP